MTTNYTSHYLQTRLLTSVEDILAHKFALALKCKPHEWWLTSLLSWYTLTRITHVILKKNIYMHNLPYTTKEAQIWFRMTSFSSCLVLYIIYFDCWYMSSINLEKPEDIFVTQAKFAEYSCSGTITVDADGQRFFFSQTHGWRSSLRIDIPRLC
jgi:hypothetical protein